VIRTLVTAPAETAVTLAEAREWLAFQSGVTEDDDVITDLIGRVTAILEGNGSNQGQWNGRKMITQTWKVTLDADEITDPIYPKLAPVSAVTQIVTYDDDGNDTTVTASNYQVRTGEYPRIVLAPSGSWPSDVRAFDSMEITCTVGYGAASVLPEDVKGIVLALIAHYYNTKGTGLIQTVSGQLAGLPYELKSDIRRLRLPQWVA
jgi:uncharacterized phiE125 gp8 family phage protein